MKKQGELLRSSKRRSPGGRLLSIALVLCMMLSLLPTMALAAANATSVHVGGVKLDSSNPYLVSGAAAASGTLGQSGCTAHFDSTTATLTLNGATISKETDSGLGDKYGVYAGGDLTIKLVGNTTITGVIADRTRDSSGIYVTGNLTIEDDASDADIATLTSSGGDGNGQSSSVGIHANGNIAINSGNIIATGKAATNSRGIEGTRITISGGTVTATGGASNSSHGINGITTISGGTVIAKGTGTGTGAIAIFPSLTLDGYTGGYQWRTTTSGNYTLSTATTFTNEGNPAYVEIMAVPYKVWVGGTQVTSDNASNVLGDGKVSYDDTSTTLTLNGATISTAYASAGNKYGIYAQGDLTIKLVGSNTITSVGTVAFSGSYGIYVDGDLTIEEDGTGTLSSSGASNDTQSTSKGIYATGNITVNSGDITAIGGKASTKSRGMCTEDTGKTTIKGGKVTATGGISSSSIGIYGTTTITGGTVIAQSTSTSGVKRAFGNAPDLSGYTGGYQWRTSGSGDYTPSTTTAFTNASYPTHVEIMAAPAIKTVGATGGDSNGTGGKFDTLANAINALNTSGGGWIIDVQAEQSIADATAIPAITKNVTLTSTNGSKIIRGDEYNAALLTVGNGTDANTVTVQSLTIDGNKSIFATLAAIKVQQNAALIFRSGAVVQNNNGRGVDVSGSFTMNGGSIAGNTGSFCGGVYMDGTMTVSGAPVITGNKKGTEANNVYLTSGDKVITVADTGLTPGASIGVSTAATPPVDITGGTNGATYISNFSSDDTDYAVKAASDNSKLLLAVDKYNVWVGGTRVTEANKGDITGAGGSTPSTSYDPATKTLTLNNYTYTGVGYNGAAIYANGNLTIVLKGTNSVTQTGTSSGHSYGVHCSGALSITGTAATDTLTATGGSSGDGFDSSSYGIYSTYALIISGNADITGKGGTANYQSIGICGITPLTISGGKVTAIGGEGGNASMGIYGESVTVAGNADVTATGGTATDGGSYGIYAADPNSAPTINGGTVTAKSGTATTSQAMSKIPTCGGTYATAGSYTVTAGDGTTNSVVSSPVEATYTGSKYVKIEAATSTPPTPPPSDDVGSYTPPLVTEIKDGDSTTASNLDSLISGNKDLTVTGEDGAKLVFDTEALRGIDAKTSGSIKVEIKDVSKDYQTTHEGKRVFSLTVTGDGKTISDFGGSVKVSLPYTLKDGEKAEDVTVWYLASDGTMTEIPCTYDAKTGLATFTVTHFSEYVVGVDKEWVNPFTDVKESDWFYGDVAFVAKKGLMSGTSATTFAPHAATSRGMIVTILYRLEGQPAVTGTNSFDDVTSGKYYENAVIWAAQNSIVSGYGDGRFGPDDDITREQLAAILYRYAASKGYDVTATTSLDAFTDAAGVSGYAVDPMKWAVANGLISGKGNGILDPQGSAERCQVAAILHRFDEVFAK